MTGVHCLPGKVKERLNNDDPTFFPVSIWGTLVDLCGEGASLAVGSRCENTRPAA